MQYPYFPPLIMLYTLMLYPHAHPLIQHCCIPYIFQAAQGIVTLMYDITMI